VCRQDISDQDPIIKNLVIASDSNDSEAYASEERDATITATLDESDGENDSDDTSSPEQPQQLQQSQSQQQPSDDSEEEPPEWLEDETEEARIERLEKYRLEREARAAKRRPEPLLIVQYIPPNHLLNEGFIEPRKAPATIKQLFVPFGCLGTNPSCSQRPVY